MKNLQQYLAHQSDEAILEVAHELFEEVVPATGKAHEMCRKINRLIDKGELRINATTYRKVYLPTLSKAIFKEMAGRYHSVVTRGLIMPKPVQMRLPYEANNN